MSRIRITGGEWRSRLIQVIDGPGLRPTPDRVRETLFNWLGQDLGGLRCLDLFAGSGILGFEAASRGAMKVALVEKERRAFLQLERNATAFADPRIELYCVDALKFRPPANAGYDLIFLDPPYRQGWLERIEPQLAALAAPGARIYAEAECRLEQVGNWRVSRQGAAGQVFYHLLEQD
jgi:16S rRNA (guanine966-N2)-methyltransferase